MTNPLLQLYQDNQLSHASLLETDPERAKGFFDDFIKTLKLDPADYLVMPAGQPLKVAEAQQVRRFTQLSRSVSLLRFIGLADIRQLTTEAANALLKTLEEPPALTYFVLATTQTESVLPTIRSRCQLIQGPAAARSTPLPSIKSLTEAFGLSKQLADSEQSLEDILGQWLIGLDQEPTSQSQKVEQITLAYLAKAGTNINRRLLLDNFLLDVYNTNQ